ncbi:MAG: response regulator transcription factor [Pseudomonadota bacterium]
MNKQILIVEDDHDIAGLVEMHLADLGHEITVCHDGEAGWRLYQQHSFDLLILDLMLPLLDGLELCKRIRADGGGYTPILMLTSKSSEMERVLGLELGADDYLTKPFSLMELLARVKALLRRTDAMRSGSTARSYSFNGLRIDTGRREVVRDGKLLELTPKEFDLLLHFASHPGEVFSRMQLLEQVWGYNHEGYEHTVNSHINRLRGKLEPDPATPTYIKTAWGVGYQFAGEPQ